MCVSVCVSVCLCMCWYAAEVAGTMSRLFLLSGSTRSLFVCVSVCVCVCVCVCVWLQYPDSSSYSVGRGAEFLSLHLEARHPHKTHLHTHTHTHTHTHSLINDIETQFLLHFLFSFTQSQIVLRTKQQLMSTCVYVFACVYTCARMFSVFVQAENQRGNRALRLQE